MHESIWIGFDDRECAAYAACRQSIRETLSRQIPIRGLVLSALRRRGLYTRPTEIRPSAVDTPILWDSISDAPMSTAFAVSRFLAPILARRAAPPGQEATWALFLDCDILVRSDIAKLFNSLDPAYAVYCVKHDHRPTTMIKMDGQTQVQYSRKNWSSFAIFQPAHPSNEALTVDMVNTLPGRDLHAFKWLKDEEIGELGPEWNWLAGHSDPKIEPACVHWTSGTPWMKGYENAPFADEGREALERWAEGHDHA